MPLPTVPSGVTAPVCQTRGVTADLRGDPVPSWARGRFGAARVARLGTRTADGAPHVVPIVFALVGEVVWSVVDRKPKSTQRLRRLANIVSEPRVSLLVDRYSDDWDQLWWVRADGTATVEDPDTSTETLAALDALTVKYRQYVDAPPPGPLVRVEVRTWRAWRASPQA